MFTLAIWTYGSKRFTCYIPNHLQHLLWYLKLTTAQSRRPTPPSTYSRRTTTHIGRCPAFWANLMESLQQKQVLLDAVACVFT